MSEIMLQLYEAAQERIAELERELVEWQDAHEQQHRAWHEARAEVERLRGALEVISLGSGPFSSDRLTHAENCIDAMKAVARAALTAAADTPPDQTTAPGSSDDSGETR